MKINSEGGFTMALPMKPFHLYDLVAWRRAKVTHEEVLPLGTTYAKTVRGAVKTFVENHTGDFIVVSNSSEQVVSLYEGGF